MARKSRKQPLQPLLPETEIQEKGFHAALYLRLSMESYEEMDANSLGHQREICLDYLKDKPEIQVWETYMDNGYSGTNFDRTDFQRMVADIQSGTINCVVVKDLSRFGRNYLDVDEYLNEKFPKWGVRFIAVLEGFDTASPTRESHFIVPFRNILNDYYVRDITEKRKTVIRAKMEMGEYLPYGHHIPYGYLPNKENCSYRIDPEIAPVVQRIFQMRLHGISPRKIVRELNQEGIISPMKYRYTKGLISSDRYSECEWTLGQVLGILHNEAYTGVRIHGKTESSMGRTTRKPPEEQIRIPNAHPPMITKEEFEQVQTAFHTSRRKKNGNGNSSLPPVKVDLRKGLNGKLFCGDCGSRISVGIRSISTTKTSFRTYCTRFINDRNACTRHSISHDKLSELLQTELNHQVDLMDEAALRMKQAEASPDDGTTALKRQLQSVKVRRNNLKGYKQQLLVDYMEGKLKRAQLEQLREKAEYQSEMLVEQETELQTRLSMRHRLEVESEQWAASVRDYRKDRAITNELIREMVERIDLFQQGKQITVQVTFRYQDVYRAFMGGMMYEAEKML